MAAGARLPKYLFGSRTRERFLKLLGLVEQTYVSEASELLGESIVAIHRVATDLERDNIIASRLMGRTRVFELNKRYQQYAKLRDLLRAMGEADPQLIRALSSMRRRPRRAGKAI